KSSLPSWSISFSTAGEATAGGAGSVARQVASSTVADRVANIGHPRWRGRLSPRRDVLTAWAGCRRGSPSHQERSHRPGGSWDRDPIERTSKEKNRPGQRGSVRSSRPSPSLTTPTFTGAKPFCVIISLIPPGRIRGQRQSSYDPRRSTKFRVP